jgi:hypothetical protein
MTENAEFSNQVDDWVRAVVTSGIDTWQGLLRSLPGVYPELVLESLKKQQICDRISFPALNTDFGESGRHVAYQLWAEGHLPTPHPLDACWWFGNSSISVLLEYLRDRDVCVDRVILIGIPTVFHVLRKKGTLKHVTLIDADPQVVSMAHLTNGYRVFLSNVVRDVVPPCCGDVILADPPWYESEMRAFLWAARNCSKSGGTIITSVPPRGTRPGISEEWRRILAWATGLGIELIEYREAALSYLSPPFEQNALAAAGVAGASVEWRRGDLAIFRCFGPVSHPRPLDPGTETWEDCCIEGVRFRVRGARPGEWSDPTFHTIGHTEVLSSVSRRDHRRDLVDVWTSGNRVFRCSGRWIVLHILRAMASNIDPECEISRVVPHALLCDKNRRLVRCAVEKISEIVRIERLEYAISRGSHDHMGTFADRGDFRSIE